MIELEGYRVEKTLSSTSQSEVYAATAIDDGAAVVIKVYRRRALSVEVSRANREFHVLRDLAASVAVPRAIEVAMVDQHPVIVTERSEGISLATFLRERREPGRSLAVFELLEIATGIASALVDVHEARVIHKDLKPQNVIVAPESLRTTIIDFGIASKLGRSQSHHDAPTIGEGTWVYAAPEQSGRIDRGIDFRTDLYSLGCVLYEMLVARAPFGNGDAALLIQDHLTRVPEAPHSIDPDVPPVLSEIAMRLLEKEPDRRYQTALGVYHDLAECRARLARDGRLPEAIELATRDGITKIRWPGELFGREAELERFSVATGRARAGAPQVVLVGGSAGVGKSTLVRAAIEPAAKLRAHVWRAKFDQCGNKSPYRAIVSAIDGWLTQMLIRDADEIALWGERVRDALGNIAGVLVELVPDFGILLGDVAPVPALGPPQTRARLELAFERLVVGLARPETPLFLVVDDLQWADASSLALIRSMLCARGDAALLLAGTYRGDAPPADAVREIEAAGLAIEDIALAPLSTAATTRMLAVALGRDEANAARLAGVLARRTENNPFLVQRLVESLCTTGLLRYRPNVGWVWDDAAVASAELPGEIAELMAAKVASLDASTVSVLQLASCVGDEFDVETLARLSREPRAEIDSALFALNDAAFIVTCRAGYRFAHDRVREAARALLSADERRRLHWQVALLLLEAAHARPPGELAFEIADHLRQTGDQLPPGERVRAMRCLLEASQRALAAGASATARDYFDGARGHFGDADWGDEPDLAFELHLAGAEICFQSRDPERALALLDAIDAHPPADSIRNAMRVAKRIQIYAITKSPEETIRVLVELVRPFGLELPLDPSPLRIRLEILRARSLYVRWIKESHAPAAGLRPEVGALMILQAGSGAVFRFNARLGLLMCLVGARIHARTGWVQPPGMGIATSTLLQHVFFPNRRRTEKGIARALDWLERVPDPRLDRRADLILADLSAWTGPRRDAVSGVDEAREGLREVGEREYEIYAETEMAYLAILLGNPVDEVMSRLEPYVASERKERWADWLSEGFFAYRELAPSQFSVARLEKAVTEHRVRYARRGEVLPLVHTIWLLVLVAYGKFDLAFEESELAFPELMRSAPTTYVADHLFYRGVAACALVDHASRSRRRFYLRVVRHCIRRLRRYAAAGPDFVHMATFLEAERARCRGRLRRALRDFDAAIARAKELGYVHHVALGHERQAVVLHAMRRDTEARRALAHAKKAYERWGARAKAASLGL